MAYIRRVYGVPAKRGGRVRYTTYNGKAIEGVIVGTDGGHLRIKMDGESQIYVYHPTCNLEYLDAQEATR